MQPKLEIYHDMRVYARLVTLWWARFRLLAPILPWSPGEKMTDVNPDVLSLNHPLQQCYPPFWSATFMTTYSTDGSLYRSEIDTFCVQYNRIEGCDVKTVLLAQ
jgi:hypothetical protein